MFEIIFNKQLTKIEREKGNSLTFFPNEFIVIDTETTGLSPVYDEIIEIGAVKIKDWEIVDEFNSLVRPEPYSYYDDDDNEIEVYVDEFITNLTGITNEMLENADSIENIIPNFIEFIGDSVLAGHNFHFDLNFLYDDTLRVLDKQLQNDFIDLMRLARRILPKLKNHKLQTICNYFNIETKGNHRALIDSKNTFECLKNLNNYILTNDIELNLLFKPSRSEYLNLSTISSDKVNFDKEHPLYNKNCVFTGRLEYLIRKDAAQVVANFGGTTTNGINKKTDILIIGSFDRTSNLKGDKSSKQKRAEELILTGQDIQIMDEETFYSLIN